MLDEGAVSRIASGLTTRAADQLGSPLDVMTDEWLVSPLQSLSLTSETQGNFDPIKCLAQILQSKSRTERKRQQIKTELSLYTQQVAEEAILKVMSRR
jgi:hypothetical protein